MKNSETECKRKKTHTHTKMLNSMEKVMKNNYKHFMLFHIRAYTQMNNTTNNNNRYKIGISFLEEKTSHTFWMNYTTYNKLFSFVHSLPLSPCVLKIAFLLPANDTISFEYFRQTIKSLFCS